ncbi:MAG: hypothetical protein PF961_18040, partial [Planctomycetota bacterium]|nr:hypothetical protein [Planctomycetota bacterium]
MRITRHPRLLPSLALFSCLALGAGLGFAMVDDPAADVAALAAAATAADADAAAWWEYARGLAAVGRHADAAEACAEVLAREPYHRGARLERVLALARASDADALYQVLSELTFSEPALALNACARSELLPYLEIERFAALAAEARVQAVD